MKFQETPRPKKQSTKQIPKKCTHKIKTPKRRDVEILYQRKIEQEQSTLPASPQSKTPESRVEEEKKTLPILLSSTSISH
ncbi:hypothetical protein RND71_032872 [Anisodus tanguticus]|uniref:Uncharacterized protein n=1 Tax=Anisodus tanguticus TaxID=243964 RepID=A0AAE1R863_9SOLA|nr:hypothetical protein RND71_032872 [Anisodus tanguticus]